ncbi:MAG: hypothetical protein GX030_09305 [Firmicutes bacterium]|nr:hypothetical protein [Bacillota bacterium]
MTSISAKDIFGETLDQLLETAFRTLQEVREQVFSLAENARTEYDQLQQQVKEIREQVSDHAEYMAALEEKWQRTQEALTDVKDHPGKNQGSALVQTYQDALQLQASLEEARKIGRMLGQRQGQLEQDLQNLASLLRRAERTVGQVGLAAEILTGGGDAASLQVSDLRKRVEIAAHVTEAQEAERMRIAREIHDGPAQLMANIVLRSEICQKLLERNEISQVLAELEELRQAVKISLREVRRIIFDLRPMALDDLGLGPALRRYIERFNDSEPGIQANITLSGLKGRLPQTLEISVFRLVQEALNNVRKHAKATVVQVSVEISGNELKIRVSDNGIGFDVTKVRAHQQNGDHYGLISMIERVELLTGTIIIDSSPGLGTTINIRLPLKGGRGPIR